ncbi:hypothetical protein M758_2G206200 [Ceratodon purpureus]|nr:hypothetical protein M758_2G206100 [Ceratodon purpureus]KAG0627504.1 hypothetical protein M758_2G206200 [Ceratodon purpureus]
MTLMRGPQAGTMFSKLLAVLVGTETTTSGVTDVEPPRNLDIFRKPNLSTL